MSWHYCAVLIYSTTWNLALQNLQCCSFAQDCFSFWNLLCLYIYFRIFFSISVRNKIGILMEIALSLQVALVIAVPTILALPVYEHGDPSCFWALQFVSSNAWMFSSWKSFRSFAKLNGCFLFFSEVTINASFLCFFASHFLLLVYCKLHTIVHVLIFKNSTLWKCLLELSLFSIEFKGIELWNYIICK